MSEASPPGAVPAELARRAEQLFRQPWHFLAGYVALEQLPPMGVSEVALAGRSNVGKSSLINALTGTRGLARTSNTPGRTQELNYFAPADGSCLLVDMPGYGYAEAPRKAVEAWNDLLRRFLRGRTSLRRVLVLIDARRGVKAVDEEMMALMDTAAVSYQAVLTKADKLKPGELARVAEATAARLARRPACFPGLLVTSAQAGTGIAELRLAVTAAL